MPIKRGSPGFRDNPTPIADEDLSVTNAVAVGFAAIPDNFDFAFIECDLGPVRIRFVGGAPTSTVGHLYNPGQGDVLGMKEIKALLAIATTATNANLRATYYRELVV